MLTEEDKRIAEMGRPQLGEIARIEVKIMESSEFKVNKILLQQLEREFCSQNLLVVSFFTSNQITLYMRFTPDASRMCGVLTNPMLIFFLNFFPPQEFEVKWTDN